jgi:hypothetical protein
LVDYLEYEKTNRRRWIRDQKLNAGCVTIILICLFAMAIYFAAILSGWVNVVPV